MTETQWAEGTPEKPMRKSLPKWVWFCGGGCLLALIVTVVAVFFLYKGIEKAADPEHGWAKLQEVIPTDTPPPPGYRAIAVPFVPFDQVTVTTSDGTQIDFQRHKGSDADRTREGLFKTDPPKIPTDMGVMSFQDMTTGTLDVQGREVSYVRLRMQLEGFAKSLAGESAEEAQMYMVFADVTPEGRTNELVLATIKRQFKRGELDDDALREVLAPFHIGTKR